MDVLLCENILMKTFEGRSFLCSQLKVQSVMMGIGMAGSRSSCQLGNENDEPDAQLSRTPHQLV